MALPTTASELSDRMASEEAPGMAAMNPGPEAPAGTIYREPSAPSSKAVEPAASAVTAASGPAWLTSMGEAASGWAGNPETNCSWWERSE